MEKSIYLSPSMQEYNVGAGNYGTEEKRMNQVADVTEKVLKRHGIIVYRNNPGWNIEQMVSDSNSKNPTAHFSIHSNALDGKARGCEIYAYASGGEGEKLARAVYAEMTPITPATDRGVRFNPSFYELRKTYAPAVLVEASFHDNPDDAQWIMSNIEEIGTAIAKGILKFLDISYTDELCWSVEMLRQKGIICDTDYWLQNSVKDKTIKGEYAALLIKSVASILKGGV